MALNVRQNGTERGASCFSGAARRIRGFLSRICRVNSANHDPNQTLSPLATGRHHDAQADHVIRMSPRGTLPRKSMDSSYLHSTLSIREMGSARLRGWSIHSLTYSSYCEDVYSILNGMPRESVNYGNIYGAVTQNVTVHNEGTRVRARSLHQILPIQPESQPDDDTYVLLLETEASATAANYSVTNTLPAPHQLHTTSSSPDSNRGDYGCLPRSDSLPSLRQVISANNKTLPRAQSLPVMRLQTSYDEFTPDITDEDNNESYSFQCSCPGLYQCRVTGLLFDMEGEGLVVYSIVPWNRRLLAQHHKKPAGPLFDIKCAQQSVCHLHLPHCEISSTGGCQFLSVAHVNDDNIEFITPHKITDTHVIINITGFSGFGNIKDEDSPADPVRALVLLFYRPSTDPDDESLINVLLLPKNVSLQDVQRTRKKSVGNERYIETPPHCKLQPDQLYTLSTCREDDSVHVEPTQAEFLSDDYENFFPSFQVKLKEVKKKIQLSLKHTTSSHCVWVREISLPRGPVKRSCGSIQTLFDIRSSFIDAISEPVLKSLLDHLLERKVMTDSEVESVDKMMNRGDKARFVIDTVRKKGEAASSEMIEFLCKVDPFLCEHLGLV